jgi:two-component system, sensor histidine kinase RegB
MPSLVSVSRGDAPARAGAIDPVGLSWLVSVRWTTLLALAGAMVAGKSALEAPVPVPGALGLLAACGLSNLWLMWRVRAGRTDTLVTIAGLLVCADVIALSWLLLRSGGVLNPASVFYLAQIVVVALVLGRTWTWIVTALSVGGYAALFLVPSDELLAAQVMHPEIALHMRGMWLAFALTALIIAVLVARLAIAVERRDRALDELRDRTARTARAAGLATLAAGAAHELSTPLSTIAVAARELELGLADRRPDADLQQDARLIRSETDRCRQILDAMAGQSGDPVGQTPRPSSLAEVASAVRARLSPAEITRVSIDVPDDRIVWPVDVIARAIGNLVQNALQASTAPVSLIVTPAGDGRIRMTVTDRGEGMSADHLSRAGEPFFTTKPAGAGTGLGLFVARSSIEQLGGSLSLSSAVGQGTTATVILPRDVVSATGHPHA